MKIIRLQPSQQKKLTEIAKRYKISESEIIRRAIDFYDPTWPTEEELEPLLKALEESQERAIKSTERACSSISETLAYFAKSPAERLKI